MVEPARAVVVGVDCRPSSVAALCWTDLQAQLLDATLVVVTALGGPPRHEGRPADMQAQQSAMRALTGFVGLALPPERAALARLGAVSGWPLPVLLTASEDADLLVVGAPSTHRMSTLRALAPRVAARARCPVAVVGRQRLDRAGRIVVGVDGSATARSALRWAQQYANATNSSLTAVMAWTWIPQYGVYPYGPTTDELQRDYEGALDAELAAVSEIVPIERVVAEARPADLLTRIAGQADLLVVGSHGATAITGRLLGSVSQKLVRRPPVPVVVIPPRWAGGDMSTIARASSDVSQDRVSEVSR